jgi:hypothetical protein
MSRDSIRRRWWLAALLSLGLLVGATACSSSSSSSANIDGTYTGTVVNRGSGAQGKVTAELHCTSKTSCVFSGTSVDDKSKAKTPFTFTLTRQSNVLELTKQSPGSSTPCKSDNSSSIIGATIKGKGLYFVKQDQWVDVPTCTAHQLDTTMHLTRTT